MGGRGESGGHEGDEAPCPTGIFPLGQAPAARKSPPCGDVTVVIPRGGISNSPLPPVARDRMGEGQGVRALGVVTAVA